MTARYPISARSRPVGIVVALVTALVLAAVALVVGTPGPARADDGVWSSNYVSNSSFETCTCGWAPSAGTSLTRVWGYVGLAAARLTVTQAGSIPLLDDVNNVVQSTVAGAKYRGSIYVTSPTPIYVAVRFREVSSSGALLGKQEAGVTLQPNTWTPLTTDYVAAAGGSQLSFQALSYTTTLGTWFDLDGASVTQWIPGSPTPVSTPTVTVTAPNSTPTPTQSTATPVATQTIPPPGCTVSATLVPSCGAWFGAAPNPLGTESLDQALVNFESQSGRKMGIYHTYKSNGQLFPSATEIARAREGRLLLVNWKPSTTLTWRQVADGSADATIDSEANYLRGHFTDKFFLTIWHEMEPKVNQTAGSGMTATDFHDMYRHVVLRLRADGVTNAVTVVNYTGTPYWGTQSWFDSLYPGDDVVDWIAEDPYSFGGKNWLVDFGTNANRVDTYTYPSWHGFYSWATAKTTKPIMLAEYGVDEVATQPTFKAQFFQNEVAQLKAMPRLRAVVYWNHTTYPLSPPITTRVDTSATSLAAWRALGADPYVNPSK